MIRILSAIVVSAFALIRSSRKSSPQLRLHRKCTTKSDLQFSLD